MAAHRPRQRLSRVKRQRAKELRRQQTDEEATLWEHLRRNQLYGLHFRRQEPLAGFIADFYCHEAHLVVEVDGSVHAEANQAEYDMARDEALSSYGLRVLRVTNNEIHTNLEGVLRRIAEACGQNIGVEKAKHLASRTSTPPSPRAGKGAGGLGPLPHRIPYGPDKSQFGDLRLPPETGPHPVVIGIHGGYWRERYGLDHFERACVALTERGIATWNIEYRRVGNPGGAWPGTFLDVASAANFLRELAPTYDLDLRRVVAVGHSAGGHLALWLAARHRVPEDSAIYTPDPLPLRAAVSLAGVVDLHRAWELGLSNFAVGELLGGSPEQYPERYAAASPYALLPLGLRQTLLHGTEDEDVPLELSERYEAASIAAGDPATLLTLPGAGHFELVDPQSSEWPSVVTAVSLLLE